MPAADRLTRLNRHIAQSGLCTRREADGLIAQGLVKVNGKVVTSMGLKIDPRRDKVEYDGRPITGARPVHLLMNKGPGISCHRGRGKSVFSLIGDAAQSTDILDPLPPRWRGLVVLSNDKGLSHDEQGLRRDHPSLYHVRMDGPALKRWRAKMLELMKEDDTITELGEIQEDSVGILLSKGSPGVLRSLLDKDIDRVTLIDRVSYGGLTKKDLPRGHWRELNEKELGYLRMAG
jgi:23S rRNA pseudouridine2605 synthase